MSADSDRLIAQAREGELRSLRAALEVVTERAEAAEAQRDTLAALCEMYRANVDAIRRDLPNGTIRQRLERLLIQVSDAALTGIAPPEATTETVAKATLGRALVHLDMYPRVALDTNQEYAAPGTSAWAAEAREIMVSLTGWVAPPEEKP